MSARSRLFLDVLLLAVFVAAYEPGRTGIPLHRWLCLALAIPALAHLVINWDWLLRVASSLAGRLRKVTRLNFAIDTGLFLSTVTVMVSGFMVSQVIGAVFGWTATTDPSWYRVHAYSADPTIVFMLVHLALHWRWVVRVVRTRVLSGTTRPVLRGEPVRVRIDHRSR
jgi:hypothetical protein